MRLLALTIVLGARQAMNFVRTSDEARRYLHGLGAFATAAVLIPIIPGVFGILLGWSALTSVTGLWCAFWSIVFFTWAAPIGLLLDMLFHASSIERPGKGFVKSVAATLEGSGRRYLRFVLAILLVELAATWVASVVPLRENLGQIPIFIVVVSLLFVSAAYWGIEGTVRRKIIRGLVIITLIGIIFSFFVPRSSDVFGAALKRLNINAAAVAKNIETNGFGLSDMGGGSSSPNAPVAILMPPGLDDLVIPPDKTFVKIELVSTNKFSGWIHLPYQWGATDFWSNTNGFWVQYVDEPNKPFWVDERKTCTMKRTIFRVSGEGGYLFLQRRT